ncbi:MAG: complex I subunit 1 family protein [Polyangiaceae bacterium]|nr:complex I subunit 1 family protein [Polyangiaceae bacterium]
MSIWLGLIIAKSAFVVLFGMNLGVLLTWTDRRQGAMMQDRIGPNRAVIWLPTRIVQAVLVLAALGAGGATLFAAQALKSGGVAVPSTASAVLFGELALFLSWFTFIVIASRVRARGARNSFDRFVADLSAAFGGARFVALAGMIAQLVLLLLIAATSGTELGETVRSVAFGAGAAQFACAAVGGSLYAAFSIHEEPRVGLRLAGLLHPAADGLKTLFKEDFIPPNADRLMHSIAPFITFFPALVVLGVVPFGDTLCFDTPPDQPFTLESLGTLMRTVGSTGVCPAGATAFKLQALDLNIGLLYFFALAGTGIVGAALAGWASDNKFSLLGGLRAASQMVSYEVALGLTLVGALMVYGTIRIDEMITWQSQNTWGIFVQPLAFVLFFAAAVAESKRIPFDLPEGESEIVAGYFTEYAGMKFAMFFFSEYIAVVSSSALMVAIFLGGWHLPFLGRDGVHIALGDTVYFHQAMSHGAVVLIGVLGFIGKIIALCWLQLSIRWTLPRFRYDQLMRLGWRKLLPLSLVNVLATGLAILLVQEASETVSAALHYLADATMALLAAGGLLGFLVFIAFLLKAPNKKQTLSSTSAQYAHAQGGTHTRRMEA